MIGKEKRRVGALRPSQLLTTFGVGAVVDLPNISVMVMGLDHWQTERMETLTEPRLLHAVRTALGDQVQTLYKPPAPPERTSISDDAFGSEAVTGVPVAAFPRWMVCPKCQLLSSLDSELFQIKHDPVRIEKTRYVHTNCPKVATPPNVLPARFLVACEHGHLDDFPWDFFVHRGPSTCKAKLTISEFGTAGEAADIIIRCLTCNSGRSLAEAFGDTAQESLPQCRGRWPHLRSFDDKPCNQPLKTIASGASNSWFSTRFTVLSLPKAEDHLEHLLQQHADLMNDVTNERDLYLMRKGGGLPAFAEYSDADIWQAITRRHLAFAPVEEQGGNLKTPEWRLFIDPDHAPEDRDFRIRAVEVPRAFAASIERVVVAERLRQVSALVGFTRIIAPDDLTEISEDTALQWTRLARAQSTWVPANEVRGEGIFLQFRETAVQTWLRENQTAHELDRQFRVAQLAWCRQRRIDPTRMPYPGLRYVLLHSFAHALMRQVIVACGYAAASLSERIYALEAEADNGPMAGILMYTAAPDSEGTLGGLVRLGQAEELQRHLLGALEQMQWCASDPLCAEHRPQGDALALHAAACHACLFAPETSCEHGNKYLDRSVLVRTVDQESTAFFMRS
jgi:hypothetical protein